MHVLSCEYRLLHFFFLLNTKGFGLGAMSGGLIVETTGFDGAAHDIETMDADREAPALLSEDIP